MIFVTPQDADNRFVIYLKTTTCKVQYGMEGLQFEAVLPRINIMKDFFINYGIKQVEIRENFKKNCIGLKGDLNPGHKRWDEFSPFRETFRKAKMHSKETKKDFSITL